MIEIIKEKPIQDEISRIVDTKKKPPVSAIPRWMLEVNLVFEQTFENWNRSCQIRIE